VRAIRRSTIDGINRLAALGAALAGIVPPTVVACEAGCNRPNVT
jgi:hypothetical protein